MCDPGPRRIEHPLVPTPTNLQRMDCWLRRTDPILTCQVPNSYMRRLSEAERSSSRSERKELEHEAQARMMNKRSLRETRDELVKIRRAYRDASDIALEQMKERKQPIELAPIVGDSDDYVTFKGAGYGHFTYSKQSRSFHHTTRFEYEYDEDPITRKKWRVPIDDHDDI